ncbi:MAG: hypothetical protein ABIF10_00270, partial [Candidatus Woesearchaeota archaeon]
PLAGSRIFFHSRAIYVFVAASVIAYAILISLGVFSFVFAVLIGLAVWLVYYIYFEKGAWDYS